MWCISRYVQVDYVQVDGELVHEMLMEYMKCQIQPLNPNKHVAQRKYYFI